MGQRRSRREQRQADQAASRLRNGRKKTKERARRDARLLAIVKKGRPPYAPHVMSWLSVKLDKPSRSITAEDVAKFVGT
ncbi:MAG: hypothetical protein NZO58_04355 [Gemmataceae bacterium]|nr:hypothetical protein [Gemmataceae bacterium]